MLTHDAAFLLREARLNLDALEAAPQRPDRKRLEAKIWFSLNHAWSILTGARLPGLMTIH